MKHRDITNVTAPLGKCVMGKFPSTSANHVTTHPGSLTGADEIFLHPYRGAFYPFLRPTTGTESSKKMKRTHTASTDWRRHKRYRTFHCNSKIRRFSKDVFFHLIDKYVIFSHNKRSSEKPEVHIWTFNTNSLSKTQHGIDKSDRQMNHVIIPTHHHVIMTTITYIFENLVPQAYQKQS